MANNIAISITADVADLQVKRAIMQAELAQRENVANCKKAQQSGETDELRSSMLAAADAVARLKIESPTMLRRQKDLRPNSHPKLLLRRAHRQR
jgi:hypothetical protein